MPDMVGGYTPFQVLANELEKAEKRSKKLDIGKVQKRAIQTTNSVYAAKDRWQGYVDEGYAEADMYANPQKYIDPNTSRRALANYATDAAASVDPRLLQSDRQLTPEEWLRVLMAAEAQAVEKRKRAEAGPVAAFFGRFMDSLGGLVSQREAKEVQQTYGAPTTGSAFADATADLAGQVATAYVQAQALAPVSGAAIDGLAKAVPVLQTLDKTVPVVGKYILPAAQRALTGAGRVGLRDLASAPEDRASGRQYAAAALMGAVDAAAEPMIGEGLTKLFPSISPYLERPLAAAGSSVVTALAAKPVSGQSWEEFKEGLLPDIIADSLMSSIGLLNKEERAKAFEDRAVRMIYPAAIKAGKSKADAEATRAGYVQALKNVRDFAEHPEAVTPDIFNALVDTQIKAREAVAAMDVPDKLKASMVKYIDDSMETLRKGVGMPEPEAEPAHATVSQAKEPEAPVGEELAEAYEPSDDEVAAGMAQMKVEGAQAEPVTPAVESAVASAVETTAATPESAAQATESAALAAVQKPIAAVAPLIPREEIAVGKKHTTTRKQPNGTFSVRTKTEVSLPTRTLAQDFPGDVDYDANRVVVTARGDDKTGRPPLQKDAVWGVYNERTKQWVAQSDMTYKDAIERAKDYVAQAVRPVEAQEPVAVASTKTAHADLSTPEGRLQHYQSLLVERMNTRQALKENKPNLSGRGIAYATNLNESDIEKLKANIAKVEAEIAAKQTPESTAPVAEPTPAVPPAKVKVTATVDRTSAIAADLAADYKAEGMDRFRAWDQFIIDRALKPEMDAGDFYAIYDRVTAFPLRGKTAVVDFAPTHVQVSTGRRVMATLEPEGKFYRWVAEDGSTGSDPAQFFTEDRYRPLASNPQEATPAPVGAMESPAEPTRPSLREELLGLETKADRSAEDNTRLEQLRSLIRVDMSQRMPGMGVKLNVDGTVKPGWRIVETNPDTRDVLVRDVAKQAEPDQWIPANKLIVDSKYNGAPPVKQTAPSTAGNAFDAVSRQLGDEVDAFIEEAQMPAGLSVQEVRGISRSTQQQGTDPYSRIDPEAAERIKASHGVARQSTIEKFKEVYTRFNNQRTREFEHLPKTPFFEPIRFRLLTLQKQRGVASDKTLRAQEAIVLGLEGDAAKTFELKAMYDDLAYEAAQGRKLAFGYTPEKLAQDKASIDELVAANPTIQQSIDKRRKAWTAIRNDFKTWSKAVGQNVDGKFDNEDYFRHQVLEYANARYNGVSQVRRVRTPSGRSYMLKRAGSEKDFNTSYIQAEYEVMANMLHDIEVMKTIDGLNKDGYNVIQKLKKQAVADNKELMLQHFEQVVQSKDEGAGDMAPAQLREAAEKAYRGTLNWRQAQGYKELERLAAVDSLPEGDSGEWKDVIDSLTKAYNLRQADPENPQETLNAAEMKRVWEYMGWLMKSVAPEAGEGKEAAGKVFRGQAYKKRYTAETLGDTAKTWEDYIPEGYVAWDPKPGTTVYMTNTVSEQLAQKILESGLEGFNINADQLHKTAAFARQEPRYVIPQEIADTLDNMASYRPKNTIDEVVRTGMRGWKKWQLLNPRRAIKYNARNLSGDAHILAVGNPSAFKQAGRASKELYQVIFADRAMTPDMKDWFERGGMESNLMVQELGDLNKLKMFQKMVDDREARGLVPLTSKIWNTYWDKVSTATNYREGILRYAAYIDYLEQMKADPQGKPKNFGASDPERVMALQDIKDRAYKLSNELMGAYDQVSVTGQWLREHMIPFWSYQEVNLVRWKQLLLNAARNKELAATVGRSFKGVNGLNAAVRVGSFAIKALGFQAALQAYNHLLFRDEEEDLPEDVRDKAHIIFGRNSNGEVIYFDRLGALDDLVEWFGADEWPSLVRDLLNKRITLPEAALALVTGVPKAIVNKVVGGVTPVVKTPAELIFKKSTYPDAFNTTPIRDRGLYLAQQLELDDLYKEIRGMPSRGYLKSIANIPAYTSDPNESAYWAIYDKTIEYQKKIGKYSYGYNENERSYALYYYKQALRYGDKEAAEKYLDLYVAKGGSAKGLQSSLRAMTPLGRLAKEDYAGFLAWLTPEEQHLLAKANDYYNTAIAAAPPEAKPANAVLGGSAKAMEAAEATK